MSTKIKIIFFGTPLFAKIILQKLLEQDDFEIAAVVTAPDKPEGRKQILTPPPVKILAQENKIPVLQPEEFDNNFIHQLQSFAAQLFVVAAHGKIIPQEILAIADRCWLNVHPSLLPKYRGASPIQAALLNGEKETGVTIMLMDEKMDHGPILSKLKIQIRADEIYPELHKRLADLGAKLLVKTIIDYLNGKIKLQEQDHQQATFCKIIKKLDGEIDWYKSAKEIYNQWRAFCVWPGVFSSISIGNQDYPIKFVEILPVAMTTPGKSLIPGSFFVQDKKLFITCGQNTSLEIKKLQPQAKKILTAQEFINGYLR